MAYVSSSISHLELDVAPPRASAETGDRGDRGARQHLSWLLARSRQNRKLAPQFLLQLRFALINLVSFAILGAAAALGLVEAVVVGDKTYLSVLIFVVFLAGLGVCALRVWQTGIELDQVKDFDPLVASRVAVYLAQLRGRGGDSRSILAAALRLRLTQRIAFVRQVAGSLVLLGLIGTVIGFIIALSGVDPDRASDVNAIAPMVSKLIEGMSTALYTTLVGAVLNVWLMVNYNLLAGGTSKLLAALMELGESHD